MVAIKQTLSALPLLLAVASKVAGQYFDSDDLNVRADFADDDFLLQLHDEYMLEERGNEKKKIDKSKIGKPTDVKGTNPIVMSDKDLESSKNRPISSSSGYIPIALDPKLKKGKRSLYRRFGGLSKPVIKRGSNVRPGKRGKRSLYRRSGRSIEARY